MITDGQVMLLLLAACPSFKGRWQTYLSDPIYDDDLTIHLGEFASHLVDLMLRGTASELPVVFDAVERLYADGDHSELPFDDSYAPFF